ncbi:DUF5689 domain-containing protein [Lacinutrix venerupis]|uniref:DUF5689 domain-containing protein n=1 Tax=Lacinutrix venerupis TaxID=1486034 RepID=A0AAC9LQJ3_9FLAO|nr:DUF5689 domain-containing protein [Lacinutrix venerupis]APY01438.1 hypothetical protein BWR22_01895 [Lacinutrix venerupis]
MKTNKLITLALSFMALIAITSCVEDDDYAVPNILGTEENKALANMLATSTEVDFEYAKNLYNSDPNNDGDNDDAIPFEVENDIYIKGYISSSDATGNFFKEFYIQNKAENPTSAFKVAIDQTDTYNQFNKGREVYINLKGLYIGEERTGSGVITIGGTTEFDSFGGTVDRVNQNQIKTNILRSETTVELTPLTVAFADITDAIVGVFVQVDNVEFADDLNGERYFDAVEVFDTQRTLQACGGFDYSEISLETSSFSTFKEELLPTGNGSLRAVVSKTFDGSTHVLALNTTDDVMLDNARCSLFNIDDFTVTFEEDFENFGGLTNEGWTNVNISGTSTDWFISGFDNNDYARISAFSSNNSEANVWLVTPAITLDADSDAILTFDLEIAYSNGIILSAYISEDFTGDPETATWEPLNAAIPYGVTNTFGGLEPISAIDISAYSGDVHIGFFYEGSDPSATTRYHIDNVRVLSN